MMRDQTKIWPIVAMTSWRAAVEYADRRARHTGRRHHVERRASGARRDHRWHVREGEPLRPEVDQ